MKITLVDIQNIRGITQLSFKPDTLTVISGKNGSGKSSITDGLKALVASGHDPTLLRKGAEKGHVAVIFGDGKSLTLTVTRTGGRTGAGETERKVRDERNREISSPVSIIHELTEAVCFDPLSFLEAKPDKQLKLLLEALPIRITPQELKAAGIPVPKNMSLDGHGLVILDALHTVFYDERTNVNRDARAKKATIAQLSEGLPEADDKTEIALSVAERELNTLTDERSTKLSTIQGQEADGRRVLNRDFNEAKAAVENKLLAEIDALREAAGAELDSLRRADQRQTNALADGYKTKREAVETTYNSQIEAKRESVGVLKTQVRQIQQAEGQRRAIAQMSADADKLEVEIEGLNASLIAVANLRQTVTAKLPIPGLEIKDGQLSIDGILLSTINTAKTILDVAVQVGILRMQVNGLPFMVIDNGERLDSAHLDMLERIATEKGLQVVVSKVTDAPFAIETRNEKLQEL